MPILVAVYLESQNVYKKDYIKLMEVILFLAILSFLTINGK